MRIVHICLACFYVDGMAYQENILPKYHNEEHEVHIITSDYAFDSTGTAQKKAENDYRNEYGIRVRVLKRTGRYGIYSKFNDYEGLEAALYEINPDIIFCHGGQFVALKDVIHYCRTHKSVRLFIDQHGDYYNMPVDTFRRRMGQYLIYGHWMRKAVPYTERFWGVTPWRCRYLQDVYGIPKEKVDLLVMGGDDDKIHFDRKEEIRRKIREKHTIADDDFLIVTGGKIDKAKNIHLLMKAVSDLNRNDIKLLIFGQPNEAMKQEFDALAEDVHIRCIGWIPSDAVYDYFLAADLAAFPGTHSVLWEQACACGLPGIFRDWEGMHHVDVGGNALFLKQDSSEEMERVILDLYTNKEKYNEMKTCAESKCAAVFSYRKIAKRAIFEE